MTEKNPWQIISSREVYDNPWISVTEFDVVNPGGGRGIYGKVHFKNRAIGVVALDEEGFIYLVGQYRFTIDQYSWEIPEGGGNPDETPGDTARRELLEETGLVAGHLERILDIHLSNSVSDEWGQIFLATRLTQAEASPEETEALQIRRIPFMEACRMVDDGRITDSLSVAGILKTRLMILENQLNDHDEKNG